MADNLGVTESVPSTTHFPLSARQLVFELIKGRLDKSGLHVQFEVENVVVVWFTFTLGSWKAVCTTTLPDGKIYEVTYDNLKKKAYIDMYIKLENIEVNLDNNQE